jgi:hypothetical protein
MFYAVTARTIPSRMSELHRKLTDGTIASHGSEGKEIVQSMRRARVGTDGLVRWSEMCFCQIPLKSKREKGLDRYFTDIKVEPVDNHKNFNGKPLMEVLFNASAGYDKGLLM